jgi:DNA-binding NtrC family response regulator
VLQEKSFERVGSSVAQKADVRILATTNRDLSREVDAGRFRGDLFFRLNVLPVRMPALRERLDDVQELAEHFLGLVADREGGRRKKLTKEALALFMEYAWPGNVRELQNLCERAAVLASGDVVPAELVASWLVANGGSGGSMSASPSSVAPTGGVGVRLSRPDAPVIETFASAANMLIGSANGSANGSASSHPATPSPGAFAAAADASGLPSLVCDGQLTLDEIERRSIVATLERFRGHRQKSAKALGIGVRTLGLKLKKWKEEALVPAEL